MDLQHHIPDTVFLGSQKITVDTLDVGKDGNIEAARQSVRIEEETDQALLVKVERDVEKFVKEQAPEMMRQMEEVFGATPQKILDLAKNGNRFAVLGFEHGKANRMGFLLSTINWILDTPKGQAALEQLLVDAKDIRDNFDTVAFCGMGGSGLSVEKAKTIFSTKDSTDIISVRTTDPTALKDVLNEVVANAGGKVREALEKLKIVAISKSGGTAETIGHLKYFLNIYEAYGIEPTKHIIVYTDPSSKMDWQKFVGQDFSTDPVRQDLQRLLEKVQPQVRFIQLNEGTDVGGRNTAPTTNVFLLPTAILRGAQVIDILKKARQRNSVCAAKNVFVRLGAYLYTLAEKYGKDKVTFVVPQEIKDVTIWAEQLIEEFDIEITEEEIESWERVEDVVNMVLEKLEE